MLLVSGWDFAAAYLVVVDRQDAGLVQRRGDVPKSGLRFSATVAFRQAAAMAATDPRAPDLTPVLRASRRLFAWSEGPGTVAFALHRPTGPGDADVARLRIASRAVAVTSRPSLGATLRAWVRI